MNDEASFAIDHNRPRSQLNNEKVLVVEDNPGFVQGLQKIARNRFHLDVAVKCTDGYQKFCQANPPYDTIVLDVHLPDFLGTELAVMIRRRRPNQEILFATEDKSSENLESLLATGCANGYLKKGGGEAELLRPIEESIRRYRREKMLVDPELTDMAKSELEGEFRRFGLIGRTEIMLDLYKDIKRIKANDSDVLLIGETGTGKELVAEALARGKLYPVNCGQYPAGSEHFMETELFGHIKGAYTGANGEKAGAFERAGSETIFLDELPLLSPSGQSKLLRVLETRRVKRLGASEAGPELKFKIIAAAKPVLIQMVRDGRFSPDLFYRLKKSCIIVPPLSKRIDDIETLVTFFLAKYAKKHKRHLQISSGVFRALEALSWPGNVRDLRHCVEDLASHTHREFIEVADFERCFAKNSQLMSLGLGTEIAEHDFNFLRDTMTKEILISALSKSRTVSEAADFLNMPRTTLNSRLKKFNINPSDYLLRENEVIRGEG